MNFKMIMRTALAAAATLVVMGSALAQGAGRLQVTGPGGPLTPDCSGPNERFYCIPGVTYTLTIYNATDLDCQLVIEPITLRQHLPVAIANNGTNTLVDAIHDPSDPANTYHGTFSLPVGTSCATGPVSYCVNSGGGNGIKCGSDCTTGPSVGGVVHIVASSDGTAGGYITCGGGTNPPQFVLSGIKWYDVDRDGVLDPGVDYPLPGFHIHLTYFDATGQHDQDATTLGDGSYAFTAIPQGATFTVTEVGPYPGTGNANVTWVQSGPANGSVSGASAANMIWTGTANTDVTGLDFFNYEQSTIGGAKYFDHNANGVRDASEVGIAGFHITVTVTTHPDETVTVYNQTTNASGNWTAGPFPVGSTYTVTETFPNGNWTMTQPTSGSYSGTVDNLDPDHTLNFGNVFGNYCLVGSGGLTIGFWSNKNGQALITPADLQALRALNLVNANGTPFDPTTNAQVKSFVLSATATNMSNMLSAQLIAMTLDVRHSFSDGGAFDLCSNENISDLLNEANTALGSDGHAVSGDPNRANQERLKNCIDRLNNGALVIPSSPCSVVYP
jgi:hypothetical protein